MNRKGLRILAIMLCILLCMGCSRFKDDEYTDESNSNVTREELEETLYEVTESVNEESFAGSSYKYGGLTVTSATGDERYIKVGVPSSFFEDETPISSGERVETWLYSNGLKLKLNVSFHDYNKDNGYNALDIIEREYTLADEGIASPTSTNYSGKCVIDDYVDGYYKRKAYKAENMGEVVMVASLETESNMNNSLDTEEAYRILDSISVDINVTKEEVDKIQEESKIGDGFIVVDDYNTCQAIKEALDMQNSTENSFTFEQLESIEELDISDNSRDGEFDLSILEYTKNLKKLSISLCIFSGEEECKLLPGDEIIKNSDVISKLEGLEKFYTMITINPYGKSPEGDYILDLNMLNGLNNLKEVGISITSLDTVLNVDVRNINVLGTLTSLESVDLYNNNCGDNNEFIPFEGYESIVNLPNLTVLTINGENLI